MQLKLNDIHVKLLDLCYFHHKQIIYSALSIVGDEVLSPLIKKDLKIKKNSDYDFATLTTSVTHRQKLNSKSLSIILYIMIENIKIKLKHKRAKSVWLIPIIKKDEIGWGINIGYE